MSVGFVKPVSPLPPTAIAGFCEASVSCNLVRRTAV